MVIPDPANSAQDVSAPDASARAVSAQAVSAQPVSSQELGVWLGLLETVDGIRSFLDEQVRDAVGISLVQFGVLQGLLHAPGGTQTMTAIADGQVSSRSGITYQVSKLVDAGLAVRQASAEDERSTEVRITDAGRERLWSFQPAHDRLVRHLLFDRVTPEQLDALEAVVGAVRTNLRQAPPRSARRRAYRVGTPHPPEGPGAPAAPGPGPA